MRHHNSTNLQFPSPRPDYTIFFKILTPSGVQGLTNLVLCQQESRTERCIYIHTNIYMHTYGPYLVVISPNKAAQHARTHSRIQTCASLLIDAYGYIYLFTFIYIYIHMCVCVYIHKYIYTCIYIYIYIYMYMYMYIYTHQSQIHRCVQTCAIIFNTCICIYIYICIYVYAYISVKMYIYVYICMYIRMCICMHLSAQQA